MNFHVVIGRLNTYFVFFHSDEQSCRLCDAGAMMSWSGCIWRGGSGGFNPPQEVVDPQKVMQNLFGGSTLTPITTLRFHFLAKPVYLCATIRAAAYQFGNLHARYSRSVSHSQSKLWPPPSENLTNTALVMTCLLTYLTVTRRKQSEGTDLY